MRKIVMLVGLVVALTACGSVGEIRPDKRYRMSSASMEPTLSEGSPFVAEVVEPGNYQPRTGDVVVFTPPETWPSGELDEVWVFRVLAVPGDTISCCDPQDRVIRNGTPLDEPYARKTEYDPPAVFEPVTVPAGNVFLLGDHRGLANDSSYNGAVPVENVIGVVKL
ncbi:signal peptidase I [Micromonospora sp. NPDC049799]|uniref:signal peptidase I n=1 Tax=Micromonospora sp. NPDC049799 TaxID=3154741 RepID=UPI00340D446C